MEFVPHYKPSKVLKARGPYIQTALGAVDQFQVAGVSGGRALHTTASSLLTWHHAR